MTSGGARGWVRKRSRRRGQGAACEERASHLRSRGQFSNSGIKGALSSLVGDVLLKGDIVSAQHRKVAHRLSLGYT